MDMEGKVNKQSYIQLIKEDIIWLLNNTEKSLERTHILNIIKDSLDTRYPFKDSYDKEFTKWWNDRITHI